MGHATPILPADLCLSTSTSIGHVVEHPAAWSVVLIEGPVGRAGAVRALLSVHFHHPDENLVEVANALEDDR